MTKPDELSTPEATAKTTLSPEQAAILASAAKVESDLTGQVQHDADGNLIDPDAVQADPVAENRDLLNMLVMMAEPALPFIGKCYTSDVIGNIAAAYTAVEEKYGWNARSMVGPELALAIFALPPTFMAVAMGRAHFAELKAQREAQQLGRPAPVPQAAASDARTNAIGAE